MDMNEPSVLYWIPIALLCYAIKVFIDVFKWLKVFFMNVELNRNELILILHSLDVTYDDLKRLSEVIDLDYDEVVSLNTELFSKIDKLLND